MAPQQLTQCSPRPALIGIDDSRARIRDDITSINWTVFASRRTLVEARDAIERANTVLARSLFEMR